MNSKRLIYLSLIVATLSIGVIIGSIVAGGVKATGEQKPAVLVIPDPVSMSNSFSGIAEKLEPAVVNIEVVMSAPEPALTQAPQRGGGGRRPGNGAVPDPNSPLGDLFGRFFGGDTPNADPPPDKATGTGFIVDKAGYILTNEHVVEHATKITVTLSDKSNHSARLIGSDCYTDLAVIKIDAGKDLQIARFGNSDAVKTGDWVLAVGSPFGFDHTVTSGIISAKGRSAEDLTGGVAPTKCAGFQSFLQTDAAINPGNSGGPLVSMAGEVIGINTAIVSETNSFAGLGFALPSNIAIKVYNQLAQNGKITRGSIGITYSADVDLLHAFGVNEGVLVQDILPGKPAALAGLKYGDIITSIDDQKITSGPMLLDLIASSPVDRSVQVRVLRDGKSQTIPVMIADRERVIPGGGETSSNSTTSEFPLSANIPEKALGISVQVVPQNVVKKYALSGVAISSLKKDSVGDDALGGVMEDLRTIATKLNIAVPPLIIDSVVVDGHVTEIRQTADYDRAIASLKRGTKFALGVSTPKPVDRARDFKYDHGYVALTLP
jgi:serine protease Do